MAYSKDLGGGIAVSDITIVIRFTEPVVTDVNSHTRQELHTTNFDDYARMGLGIALFCLVLMDFIVPSVDILIVAIAMISACFLICFVAEYNSKPHVKKWAEAALVTLSLTLVITIISIIISFAIYVASRKESDTDLTIDVYFGILAIVVIVSVLIFLVLVFYALLHLWS